MCEHGRERQYKAQMKKDGSMGYMWECAAAAYPDPAQCPTVWINKPRETK